MALIHGVDFRIEKVDYMVEEQIIKKYKDGEISKEKLNYLMHHHNNVIKQTNIKWRVNKD